MPFSARDFFDVFSRYNTGVWPAQIGLLALALALLAVLWAWCGVVYHLVYFARLTPMAYVFGALFLVQAAAFGRTALRAGGEVMALGLDGRGLLGTTLIAYALFFYPLISTTLGQLYPATPSFGLPCPLTIFTFGVLTLAVGRVPGHLLVIPSAWALVGISAALNFGVLEDLGLPVAALCGVAAVLAHNGRVRAAAPPRVGETPARPEGIRRLH